MRICRCCGEVLEEDNFYKSYDSKKDIYRYSSLCKKCTKSKYYNIEVTQKQSKADAQKQLRFKKIVDNLKIHGNSYVLNFDVDKEQLEKEVGKKILVRDADGGGFVIYVEK